MLRFIDQEMVSSLNDEWIEFPVSKKSYCEIETKNDININLSGYGNKQAYPIYFPKESFENHMELLLLLNEDNSQGDKSWYVYINDFNRFVWTVIDLYVYVFMNRFLYRLFTMP